jgi:hypothetical protein
MRFFGRTARRLTTEKVFGDEVEVPARLTMNARAL